jgi:hypothetical protein
LCGIVAASGGMSDGVVGWVCIDHGRARSTRGPYAPAASRSSLQSTL